MHPATLPPRKLKAEPLLPSAATEGGAGGTSDEFPNKSTPSAAGFAATLIPENRLSSGSAPNAFAAGGGTALPNTSRSELLSTVPVVVHADASSYASKSAAAVSDWAARGSSDIPRACNSNFACCRTAAALEPHFCKLSLSGARSRRNSSPFCVCCHHSACAAQPLPCTRAATTCRPFTRLCHAPLSAVPLPVPCTTSSSASPTMAGRSVGAVCKNCCSLSSGGTGLSPLGSHRACTKDCS